MRLNLTYHIVSYREYVPIFLCAVLYGKVCILLDINNYAYN